MIHQGSCHSMGAINVRCLPEVDLDSLEVQHFNGRDL